MFQFRLFRRATIRRPVSVPDPEVPTSTILTDLWQQNQLQYFPERTDLLHFRVGWSRRRQKRTLASVNLRTKVVNVARELQDPLFHQWLPPLLHHEMCHAVLGENVARRGRKRSWHGEDFKRLEMIHPEISHLNEWIRSGGWLYAVRRHRARKR